MQGHFQYLVLFGFAELSISATLGVADYLVRNENFTSLKLLTQPNKSLLEKRSERAGVPLLRMTVCHASISNKYLFPRSSNRGSVSLSQFKTNFTLVKHDRRLTMSEHVVLHGWKAIANYLNRGVRTVQRLERSSNFPVRRINAPGRTGVFAFCSEIDEWLVTDSIVACRYNVGTTITDLTSGSAELCRMIASHWSNATQEGKDRNINVFVTLQVRKQPMNTLTTAGIAA